MKRMLIVALVWVAARSAVAQTAGSPGPAGTLPPGPPNFVGTELAKPPQAGKQWTPPRTKLPDEWRRTTALLLQHGFGDPRGCEYREVDLVCGSVWSAEGRIVTTHAWLIAIPAEKPVASLSFAVAWNGLVYPVRRIGARADLRDDVSKLPKHVHGDYFGSAAEAELASHQVNGVLKACLLLVLGEGELAEWVLSKSAYHETVLPGIGPPKEDEVFLQVARLWAWAAFDRAVCAHLRGDDVVSLESARTAARWRDVVEREAARLDPERPIPVPKEVRRYITFLAPLDELIADQARRAAAGPVQRVLDPKSPPIADQKERIAALVRDLQCVDDTQFGQPGGVDVSRGPVVNALVKEGEASIEPLLECLEHDRRLARSVEFHRDFGTHRNLLGVAEPAFMALTRILDTNSFGPRADVMKRGALHAADAETRALAAQEIRDYWAKTKGRTDAERWFLVLADDDATPEQWLEAAQKITASTARERPRWNAAVDAKTLQALRVWQPLAGEPLRAKSGTSVGELLAKRAEHLTTLDPNDTRRLHHLGDACRLTLGAARWDPQAALPEIRRRIEQIRELTQSRSYSHYATQHYQSVMPHLVMIGVDAGAADLLDQYFGWLRELRTDGSFFPGDLYSLFQPLARYSRRSDVQAFSRELFVEKNWLNSVRGNLLWKKDIFSSPLIGLPGFREYLQPLLRDKSEFGTVEIDLKQPSIAVKPKEGGMMGGVIPRPADADAGRFRRPIAVRNADFVAWRLSFVEGAPAFEIYWPEDRRDTGIAAMIEFLGRYGDCYGDYELLNPPQYFSASRFGPNYAKFRIAKLDRVATADDVGKGRALFTLADQGTESRLGELPKFPQPARWSKPPAAGDAQAEKRSVVVNGFIWQAEEVLHNGHWRRYFGFVGKHDIARVPAEQIEFVDVAPEKKK